MMEIIYFFSIVSLNYAFNLEPRLAIIKRGPDKSYFGYSVAQHLRIDDDGKVRESLMLIGAPRAQNNESESRAGAAYKCQFTTANDDCTQFSIDETDGEKVLVNGHDQWIGVTVKSQKPGGVVLVRSC
jgi:hypothetical protein